MKWMPKWRKYYCRTAGLWMGFCLTAVSSKTYQRQACVVAGVAGLGEFFLGKEWSSFSSAFGSLLVYSLALLHANGENHIVMVVCGMELVCMFPTLNSCETDIPKERGAMYRGNGVTFQFAGSGHSCPASGDIQAFCLGNHKANRV